jgi:uncharacterized membrane protein
MPPPATPLPSTGGARPGPAEVLARDYDLPIGGSIEGGWTAVKNNFWPAVGVSFLIIVISMIFSQIVGLITRSATEDMIYQHHFTPGEIFLVTVVSIASAPFHVVLFAGLYVYFLKLIRGQPASVGDVFAGFGHCFGQLLLLGWVQALLTCIGFYLCILPGIYLAVAYLFTPVLVIDRELGFWEAMELSRRVVSKHWFVVFGFAIVYFLVVLAGILGCCIGIFVTIPIGIAALMWAYEYIFSRPQ